ncbi:MAG: urea carboxylase-associated family protein [Cyanobacteria bacterium P01_G01_bin.38]
MTLAENELTTIPARRGCATRVARGQSIKIINTHGYQVIDTWAFNAHDLTEFMSMEHTRTRISRIVPRVGDAFVTNRRRPILTWLQDTSPGVHDTLIAACDRYRYELLGAPNHDNCTENLATAFSELGLALPEVPCPLNLFMNTPVSDGLNIEWLPPVSQPGDFVVMRAEIDCIVAFSACPQDLVPINGADCHPADAHFALIK